MKQIINKRYEKENRMLNVFIRTVILYVIIVVLLRLTGKRQIGQLELTELVTAFMISELASSPITDNSIPLLYGVIPAITLVCLEVFLSYAAMKSRCFRRLVTGRALPLVNKGKIDKNQMNKARITLEELLSAMRCNSISCMSDIEYAFLEPNGTISIIPKSSESPPSANDMNVKVSEKGIEHSIIVDSDVSFKELEKTGKNEKWLNKKLKEKGFSSVDEVFYMGVNELEEIYIIGKDE